MKNKASNIAIIIMLVINLAVTVIMIKDCSFIYSQTLKLDSHKSSYNHYTPIVNFISSTNSYLWLGVLLVAVVFTVGFKLLKKESTANQLFSLLMIFLFQIIVTICLLPELYHFRKIVERGGYW